MRIQSFILCAEYELINGACRLTTPGFDRIGLPIFPVKFQLPLFIHFTPEPDDGLGKPPLRLVLYGPGADAGLRLFASQKAIIEGSKGKSLIYEVEFPFHAPGLYRLEGLFEWSKDEPFALFQVDKGQ